MNIVTVVPLSRGIFKDQLSYFTSSKVSVGSLVSVPVRKKTVHALVVDIQDAKKMKTSLKSAPFSIKKIQHVHEQPLFSTHFFETARSIAEYHATTLGSVIEALVPKAILEAYEKNNITEISHPDQIVTTSLKNEPYVFQTDDAERMATYKSFTRESFAQNKSVFFCLPTAQKIEHVYSLLEKGIDAYTFVLHSKLTAKQIVQTWNDILASTHPVLIIATGNFLSIPRNDIGAIILDYENSRGYKAIRRPFIDYRMFVEEYTKYTTIKLIYGDMFLRVETLEREKRKEMIAFAPIKYRMLKQAQHVLVDMTQKNSEDTHFHVLSPQLHKLIEHAKQNNEHVCIISSRRGLHPITICGDCGSVVACESCNAPMTVHKQNGKNIFICHKCGNRSKTEITCKVCGSWKLVPLGVGSQLTEKEIIESHPHVKTFRLDSDTAQTPKQARTIVENFLNSPGSILVGTEMALSYLNEPIDNVAVASIDSLFALPDFRGNERIFNLLLRLHCKALNVFMIQTRNPTLPIFDYILKGNLLEYYRDEIQERKELGYPPF
jgi:primosomal protein N' (replication factor Y)